MKKLTTTLCVSLLSLAAFGERVPNTAFRKGLKVFAKNIKDVSGMAVGYFPSNSVATCISKDSLSDNLSPSTGWKCGDGVMTIAVCVGYRYSGGLPRNVIMRDFSYSSDGRLVRVSNEYLVEVPLPRFRGPRSLSR